MEKNLFYKILKSIKFSLPNKSPIPKCVFCFGFFFVKCFPSCEIIYYKSGSINSKQWADLQFVFVDVDFGCVCVCVPGNKTGDTN